MKDWVVGETCYVDFKLGEVESIASDGRVTGVVYEGHLLGHRDLRKEMQSVTPHVEKISLAFSEYYGQLNEIGCGLNFPDIHQWLIERWMKVCNNPSAEKSTWRELDELMDFIRQALSLNYKGLTIFRCG